MEERSLPSVLSFNSQSEKAALLLLSLLGRKNKNVFYYIVAASELDCTPSINTYPFDFSQYLQIACAEENKLNTLRKQKYKEE